MGLGEVTLDKYQMITSEIQINCFKNTKWLLVKYRLLLTNSATAARTELDDVTCTRPLAAGATPTLLHSNYKYVDAHYITNTSLLTQMYVSVWQTVSNSCVWKHKNQDICNSFKHQIPFVSCTVDKLREKMPSNLDLHLLLRFKKARVAMQCGLLAKLYARGYSCSSWKWRWQCMSRVLQVVWW